MFKCYNQVPGASTNPENMKKINPVHVFLVSLLQACEKNERVRFRFPLELERGSNYNINAP